MPPCTSNRVVDAHIAARLRQRRTELAITKKRLGEVCGVAYQQIAKYESAVDRIPVSRLYQMGCFLQIPVDYFFAGLPAGATRTVDAVTLAADAFPSSKIAELIAAYYQIANPKLRRAVARLIRVMSEAHG
jgi:transcriptional regulator with XRE-family HTH domain